MKVLIAEDDLDNAYLLETILKKSAFSVEVAYNGREALERLKVERFDALLTDWMMPEMDGMELIRQVRKQIAPVPLIIMVTAIDSTKGRAFALDAGADDYVTKPYSKQELLKSLGDGLERSRQKAPEIAPVQEPPLESPAEFQILPPFVGVVIAASTGGPPAIMEIIREFPEYCEAAFFTVQHGPAWMLETFADRLQEETGLKTALARTGKIPKPGEFYLAPGDCHLCLKTPFGAVELTDDPEENFVRPSADPLFRSAARLFGKYCVGVILTGMGRDGTQGAAEIIRAGGTVLVQEPRTAIAISMPQTAISSGVATEVVPLKSMGKTILHHVVGLSSQLQRKIQEISSVAPQ
ncbi:MAG: chemotaxis protein CheB [Nitrospinales bacterium]